ncbi:hypothetical protein [Halochromatium glycolicum]|uniref:hypothetical protein n=1 Tax=Halochromatium glycolicum TaxID=85075 RepID=UPI001A9230C7|nr:hypothetical protein [Halochromatium glycolicum]
MPRWLIDNHHVAVSAKVNVAWGARDSDFIINPEKHHYSGLSPGPACIEKLPEVPIAAAKLRA